MLECSVILPVFHRISSESVIKLSDGNKNCQDVDHL